MPLFNHCSMTKLGPGEQYCHRPSLVVPSSGWAYRMLTTSSSPITMHSLFQSAGECNSLKYRCEVEKFDSMQGSRPDTNRYRTLSISIARADPPHSISRLGSLWRVSLSCTYEVHFRYWDVREMECHRHKTRGCGFLHTAKNVEWNEAEHRLSPYSDHPLSPCSAEPFSCCRHSPKSPRLLTDQPRGSARTTRRTTLPRRLKPPGALSQRRCSTIPRAYRWRGSLSEMAKIITSSAKSTNSLVNSMWLPSIQPP